MYEFKSFKLAGKVIDTEMCGDGMSGLTPKNQPQMDADETDRALAIDLASEVPTKDISMTTTWRHPYQRAIGKSLLWDQ